MAAATYTNVYARDLKAGLTTCVSQAARGEAGDGPSYQAATDTDGMRVAYVTEATNLGWRDNNHTRDVVLRDLRTTGITMISRAAPGRVANGPSWRPVMSSTGRYVAFVSGSSDLICRRRCS